MSIGTEFSDFSDLPEDTRFHLAMLVDFIGDLDGKTIGTPSLEGDAFFDDGTVDAETAVQAFNNIVLLLRVTTQPTREGEK